MVITFTKKRKNIDALISRSKETSDIISERNIHHRLFEENRENDNSFSPKPENRFNAERELSGKYMYSLTITKPKKHTAPK